MQRSHGRRPRDALETLGTKQGPHGDERRSQRPTGAPEQQAERRALVCVLTVASPQSSPVSSLLVVTLIFGALPKSERCAVPPHGVSLNLQGARVRSRPLSSRPDGENEQAARAREAAARRQRPRAETALVDFSRFWRLESPRPRCQPIWVPAGLQTGTFCVLTRWRKSKLSCLFLLEGP